MKQKKTDILNVTHAEPTPEVPEDLTFDQKDQGDPILDQLEWK